MEELNAAAAPEIPTAAIASLLSMRSMDCIVLLQPQSRNITHSSESPILPRVITTIELEDTGFQLKSATSLEASVPSLCSGEFATGSVLARSHHESGPGLGAWHSGCAGPPRGLAGPQACRTRTGPGRSSPWQAIGPGMADRSSGSPQRRPPQKPRSSPRHKLAAPPAAARAGGRGTRRAVTASHVTSHRRSA